MSMTTIIPKPELVRPALLIVAEYYGTTFEEMQTQSRDRHVVLARRVSIAILRRLYPLATNSQIAGFFGRENHTFVTDSIQALNDLVAYDPRIAQDVNDITAKVVKRQGADQNGQRPNS